MPILLLILTWVSGLTHADGVGGVQLATMGTLAVEGPGHVAAHPVDTGARLTFIYICNVNTYHRL